MTSIEAIKMTLPKFQDDDKKTKKLRLKRLPDGWEDIEEMFYYQGLSYIAKVIYLELISRHYNNSLASHFDIEQTGKLIA